MEWLRWYHGAISDPKWPIVARKSGQNIGTVVSVWAALLEYASQASPRGSVDGFDSESVDALFGYDDGTTESVFEAMKKQGLIETPCNTTETPDETGVTFHLVSWEKRQVKRERNDNSSERVRKHRAEKKNNKNNGVAHETQCNASVTPPKHHETPRTEQNREENKEPPISPTGDGVGVKTPRSRTPRNEKPIVYSLTFETAWAAYPRKVEKGAAWAAWEKAAKRGMQESTMPGIIRARSAALDWAKDSGRYVPHMATWLNKNGWEDEISTESHGHDQFAGVL